MKQHPLALFSTAIALLVWLMAAHAGVEWGHAFTLSAGIGVLVGASGIVGQIAWRILRGGDSNSE